jgi:VanZ family protein
MQNQDLALRSGTVLDIAPRTARLLTLAGVLGVILVVVGSLVGDRPETIEVDKVIHFSAYTTLSIVFVLSLRPRWCIPALIGLALLSYLIEFLQPLNLRSMDVDDAIANTLGVLVGAGLGLALRYGYGYLKSELESARIRRSLITLPAGTTLVRQGEIVDKGSGPSFSIKKATASALNLAAWGRVKCLACWQKS